jgi:hypothetical protein
MSIEFDVSWAPSEHKTVSREPDKTIREVVQSLVVQLNLPEYDPQGRRIVYGLYREHDGERELLQDARTLKSARIQAQTVYIANVAAPWWQSNATLPAPKPGPRPPTKPLPRRLASPSSCRLKLAPNCTVVVQGDYLELDRTYLSSILPQTTILAEKAHIFSGFDSRLMHVSRKNHCAIIRQGDHWLLRAYKPTYVNGKLLNNGQTVTIQPPGAEVVLGNGGWPITIELFEA